MTSQEFQTTCLNTLGVTMTFDGDGLRAWTVTRELKRIDVRYDSKNNLWYYLGECGAIGEGESLGYAQLDYIRQSW